MEEICGVSLPQGLVSGAKWYSKSELFETFHHKETKDSMRLLSYYLANCPATPLGFHKYKKHLGREHCLQNETNKWGSFI